LRQCGRNGINVILGARLWRAKYLCNRLSANRYSSRYEKSSPFGKLRAGFSSKEREKWGSQAAHSIG